MSLFALQHFWCYVVRRATNSPLSLTIKLELGGKSEVSDFNFHFVVQEKVSKLEVTMDDSVRVEVLDGVAHLYNVALHLQLMQLLPASQQLIK